MDIETIPISTNAVPTPPANSRKGARSKKDAVQTLLEGAEAPSPSEMLATLESKLSQTKTRQTEISAERKAIALAAHMGSAGDRARLDQLNQEGAVLAGEIESIEAAIAAVKVKIADAEAAAAREAEREKIREISRIADEVRVHAETIDGLWRQSIAEFVELQTKLHKIAQSSGGRPALHVIQSASRRALISAFNRTPLQIERLGPGDGHTMADLSASWLRNSETGADRTVVKSNGRG